MITLTAPNGATVKTTSNKRWHIVAMTTGQLRRFTSSNSRAVVLERKLKDYRPGGIWIVEGRVRMTAEQTDPLYPAPVTDHFNDVGLTNFAAIEAMIKAATSAKTAVLAERRDLLRMGFRDSHPFCKELDATAAQYALDIEVLKQQRSDARSEGVTES